jgi:sporulation protein YlmC with PRC-barrel domain
MRGIAAASFSLFLCSAGSANAQATDNAARAGAPIAQHRDRASAGADRIARITDYTGKEVLNLHGEKLGEIVELAIDGGQGRVVYAVLASGGWLGLGQDLYAVPIGALQPNVVSDALRLGTAKTRLDERDAFNPDQWPIEANHKLIDNIAAGASPRSQRPRTLKDRTPSGLDATRTEDQPGDQP